MPTTLEQVTCDALMLPERARAQLAQTLLHSLDGRLEEEADVAEAWDEEIKRRVESVRNGTAKSRPAEDVFRDLMNRLQK